MFESGHIILAVTGLLQAVVDFMCGRLHNHSPERTLSLPSSDAMLHRHVRANWAASSRANPRKIEVVWKLLPHECIFLGDCNDLVGCAGAGLPPGGKSIIANFCYPVRNGRGMVKFLRGFKQRLAKEKSLRQCQPFLPIRATKTISHCESAGAGWSL